MVDRISEGHGSIFVCRLVGRARTIESEDIKSNPDGSDDRPGQTRHHDRTRRSASRQRLWNGRQRSNGVALPRNEDAH
jgi:hypothetical protein